MKITFWRQTIARALLSAGILIPAGSFAAELRTNLVVNPGFENVDTSDTGPFSAVRLLDWLDADGDNDDTYSYPYSSNYSGNPVPPGAAAYHFAGGFGTTSGAALVTQSLDVSTGDSGALIATGNASYDLRAFFSGYLTQADVSAVRARFLDTGGVEIGSDTILGSQVLATVPIVGGQVGWGQGAAWGTLPVNTATVAVDVLAEINATNHDGYVDLIDFSIGGLADDAAMKLEIDPVSGRGRFSNLTNDPLTINYYEITSQAGSLNVNGWNSLQDQDFENGGGFSGTGDGWEEAGGSRATVLSESYLLGSSTIATGQVVSLGSPMTSGGAQDLVFRYGLENGLLLYGFVDYVTLAGVGGDFNGDGTYDCLDVNALTGVIAAGSNDAAFDLTGDGSVDGDDLNAWLTEAGAAELPSGNPFRLGDANLDGFVDVSDFNVWNSNRFSTRPEWCSADFNADGVVDVSDFNLWNGNKFTASSLAAVPEPMGWGWLLTLTGGWLGLAARQRLGRDDGGPAPSAAARK